MIHSSLYRSLVSAGRRMLSPRHFHLLRNMKSELVSFYKSVRLSRYTKEPKKILYCGTSFKIVLDPRNGLVDEHIAFKGTWEPHIFECLSVHLAPNDVFLDIGANIGIFTLFAAARVGPGGLAIACEPIPRLADQIRKSAVLNKFDNLSVYTIACSDTEGIAVLHERPGNVGGSTLRSVAGQDLFVGAVEISVKTVRLDDILDVGQRIDFVKIDIEGFELYALKGMERILSENKPKLLIEFSPEFYKDMEGDVQKELVTFLTEKGYSFFDPDGAPITVEDLDALTRQKDVLCMAR